MFAHWYCTTGRIGRTEYLLTLLISVSLFFCLSFTAVILSGIMGSDIKDDFTIKLVTFICTVPSIYLAIVAGIKRAHDTACSPWYSLTPLIPVFFLNIVTAVLFVAGCIFLIKDKSMEGVNEYGTNPTRPYADQLAFHA